MVPGFQELPAEVWGMLELGAPLGALSQPRGNWELPN